MTPEEEILQAFPELAKAKFAVTSPKDFRYNCIAWAGDDSRQWWEPSGMSMHYWPHGDLSYSLQSYLEAYRVNGYVDASDSSVEIGFEKVAVYVDSYGIPTHASKQKPNGLWTSKLGEDEDIEHEFPEGVEGKIYGKVHTILKRRILKKK
ncbi:MAG: hypothetical protein KA746_05485 [Pyrinomonadaceae bacterium]|nr:hypothetical protein [Pyrinomonadaceae bacterium]